MTTTSPKVLVYKVYWDSYRKDMPPQRMCEFFKRYTEANEFFNTIRVTRPNAQLFKGTAAGWKLLKQSN